MKRLSLIALLIVLAATPALAEQRRSAMSYTTKGTPAEKELSTVGHIGYKNAPQEQAGQQGGAGHEDGKSPSDKVWKKYKALAAGQYEDGKKEDAQAKAAKEKQAAPSPSPTGFAAILERYRQSKESRRGMKSMRVPPPEAGKAPEQKEGAEVKEVPENGEKPDDKDS